MYAIVLLKNLKGRGHSEDLGKDGRMISELILEKAGGGWVVADWTHLSQDWKGPVSCSCEDGNEPSDYIKWEEFLDELSDYLLLKMTLETVIFCASILFRIFCLPICSLTM
jgi:hypothetical protein